MNARSLVPGAIVAALAVASCHRAEGPANVRELAGADAATAFVVDDLGKLVTSTQAFVTRLTKDAGAGQLAQTRASFAQQFGLDPLDRKSYDAWGIDTARGLVVFTEGTERSPILGLPVSDSKKLDESLKAAVSKTDGASKMSTESVGPYTLEIAGRPFGSEVAPSVLWAHVGRFVLVARAEARPALEAALKRLAASQGKPAASLATDATFRELAGKLSSPDAILFERASASTLAPGAAPLGKGSITGIRVSGGGLDSDTFVALAVPGLDRALAGAPVADLASRVGDDAVLVALSRAARPDAVAALRRQKAASVLVDRALAPLGDETGLDPEKDVLPLLAGPFTASVHVERLDELATELRRHRASGRDMLDWLHVVFTADVRDARAMGELLERARASLQKRGVVVDRKTVKVAGKDAVVYTPEPRGAPKGATPKLGWALLGDTYVYAAGPGRLDRELALLAGGGPSVAGALGQAGQLLAGEDGATVMVVRAAALANQARGPVPPAGSGQGGPDSLAEAAVELLHSIGDVAVALTAEPDGLRLRIREKLE